MSFIDERIVKMTFDSKQFEKGIAATMDLLDKFQNALMLKGASAGITSLQKSVSNFSFEGLGSAADTVAARFTNLGIVGTTALVKITNQAIDAGEKLLKSLSIDQVTAGWQKFGDKTTSVGTLVAQGNSLEFVNEQMDRLNWFTDETSYNFTDMVSNIAKFTASGQGLKESVTMMEGIALWAAASGQNAGTASRAMYQLSQAMGSGVMRKEDWKSIQNTSMDTDEFRQVALDTAVALGKLKKTGEDTYKSLQSRSKKGAAEFKKAQFADSLTEGAWFDTDVMAAVYEKYGAATERLKEYADANETTASEAIAAIEAQDKAMAEAYSKENNVSIEEATKTLIEQGKILDPLALKWFKAGQEARTFGDVIDSVKDAVSTQFMNIFQNIFGNYEEATKLYTNLANELWDIFAGPLLQVKELLDLWHDFGGRTHLLYGMQHAWEAILALTAPIQEAFDNIFPSETTWQGLVKATFEFSKFTNSLKISDETAEKLKRTFQGVFSIFDLGKQAIGAVFRVFKEFIPGLKDVAGGFLDITGSIGDFITDMASAAKENDFFYNSIKSLIEFVAPAFEFLKNAIENGIKAFEDFTGIDLHIPTFKEFTDTLGNIKITLDPVISVLKGAADAVHNFFESMNQEQTGGGAEKKVGIFEKLVEIFGKLAKIFGTVFGVVKEGIGTALNYFSKALDNVDGNKITGLLGGGLFALVAMKIKGFIDDIKDKLSPLSSIKDSLIELKDGLLDTFGAVQDRLNAGRLITIAAAIGILAASLIALAGTENIGTGLAAIGGLMLELLTFLSTVELIGKIAGEGAFDSIGTVAGSMLKLSIAILVLSKAMSTLGKMDYEEIVKGLVAVGGLMMEFVVFAGLAENYEGGVQKASKGIIAVSVGILILSAACKVFSGMEWEEIGKGLAGVGALLAEVGIFAKFVGEAKHIAVSAASMIMIAGALTILTGVLFVMGKTSETMRSGLLVLAGLLIELGTAVHFMNDSLAGAAAIIIVAGAIAILTPALVLLGAAMTGDGIARALITLAGALFVMGAAAGIMGMAWQPMLIGAGVLAAFGAALVIAGAGLAAFGLGLTTFTTGLVASGAAIVGGVGVIGKALELAVTLIIQAIEGMLKQAVMLVPFVVELALMLIEGFLAGIARHLPGIIAAGASIILAFITGVTQYLPDILQAGIALMVVFINGMADGIRDNTDTILGAMGNLVSALIELVLTGVQDIVTQIPGIGGAMYDALEEAKKAVRETLAPGEMQGIGEDAVNSTVHGFETASGDLVEKGGAVGKQFGNAYGDGSVEGIEEKETDVVGAAEKTSNSMLDALGSTETLGLFSNIGEEDIQKWLDGMDNKDTDVTSMSKAMRTLSTGALDNSTGEYFGAGENGVLGFIKGLGSHDADVTAEGARIANLATSAMMSKQGLDEHSPSKKTYKIGVNAGKGYVNGFESTEGEITKTSKETGKKSGKALQEGIDSEIGILNYASGAVDMFQKKWLSAEETLGDTSAIQISTDAMEVLALSLYQSSDAAAEAVTTAEGNAKSVADILKNIKASYTEMRQSVIQTLDSQIDMLSGFDVKMDIHGSDMIKNMESNIDAMSMYIDQLNLLAERGISEGLLQHLKDLGPKGLNEINAFVDMSAEQLDRANQLWEQKTEMMNNVADRYMADLAYVTVRSAESVGSGLNAEANGEQIEEYVGSLLTKLRESVGVNLQNFEAVGEVVASSVASGLKSDTVGIKETDKAAKNTSNHIVNTMDQNIREEDGVAIGQRLCEGIAKGIRDNIEVATTAAEEMALALIEKAKEALGIASPSKIFAELGYYSDAGLAEGITKYSPIVRDAAVDTANDMVGQLTGVFGQIADMVDGNIDLDPTIRPVLDLTNIMNGSGQISSLLGLNDPYSVSAAAAITGIQNGPDLALQISDSINRVIDKLGSTSEQPRDIIIHIYPTENQSPEDIADAVSYRINHEFYKKAAVRGGA